jgi:hypothetical protein
MRNANLGRYFSHAAAILLLLNCPSPKEKIAWPANKSRLLFVDAQHRRSNGYAPAESNDGQMHALLSCYLPVLKGFGDLAWYTKRSMVLSSLLLVASSALEKIDRRHQPSETKIYSASWRHSAETRAIAF